MEHARPRTGLAIGLVALVLFAPLIDGGTTYVPATVIRLGALSLALIWLWRALGADAVGRRPTPLDLPVIAFLTLAALSTATSPYRYESLQAFLSLATGALVLAIAAEVARERRASVLLAGAVFASAAVEALLALGQWAMGADRPAGTYFNPNHLATALAVAMALVLAREPRGRTERAALVAAAGLLVAALIASRSRGGVLAAAAGVGLVGWYRWRWRAVAVGAAALVLVAIVPNPLVERVRHAHAVDPLAYARLQIWRSALERAADHPLGVGLNMFRKTSQQYAFPVEGELARYGRRAESAHSDYLEVLAELGVPGFLVALWGLGALGVAARRRLAAGRSGGRPDGLVLGAAGGLAAIAAQAAVDNLLSVPALVVQGAVLTGIVLGAGTAPEPAAAPGQGRPVQVPWMRRPVARALVVVAGVVAGLGVARHGVAFVAARQASAARDAGDLAAARVWLERAAWLAPDSAAHLDALAAASVMAWRASRSPHDAMAAEAFMLQAARLDPDDARRFARLAEIYVNIEPPDPEVRRRALERARRMYEEAERLDPYAAAYPLARAAVLARLGERDAEIAALERAVSIEPNLLAARLRLARIRAERREVEAAAAQYAAIEATLDAYEAMRAVRGESPFARWLLGGVDRQVVRREAAALRGRS